MKKYTLSIPFDANGKYTLTGANSSASFSPSDDIFPDNTETLVSGKTVSLSGDNKYHITRARLVSTGAPGLQSGSALAASLDLAVSDGTNIVHPFKLDMNKWNEWEEKNIFIPKEDYDRLNKIAILETSVLYVHDFNIQSDYVGEDVVPTLELEIEGDFLVASDTNV